jgi:hypothetical protein
VTEDPVAIVGAAARRAWGALLCYYLRVALAARERNEHA